MFKTSDGCWVTLAASTQQIFEDLCRAIDRADLITDPRFADNPARVKHRNEINGIVADWIAQRTRDEVAAILDARGLPYTPVFDIQDIFGNEHYLARSMLVRVLDQQLGDAVVQNVVPKFSATPGSVNHLGPRLGEHNDEVYRGELGYSAGRMQELRDAGVI
jgi:crotonobetainyl-CoA:carnitine CoA-transferase CaiB-like acyl-CoA transferase